jgi:flagellar basal-body rod modification protein FlgD
MILNSINPFATTKNPSPYGTNTPAAANSNSGSSSSSGASGSNELNGNDFITLLTAQLQAQDPLNPIDPTTFVTQLVEFNQLQQLIDINTVLDGAAGAGSSGSGTSGSGSAGTDAAVNEMMNSAAGASGSGSSNNAASAFTSPAVMNAMRSAALPSFVPTVSQTQQQSNSTAIL